MTWNQAGDNAERFYRKTCPICGGEITGDNSYGSMDVQIQCSNIAVHYKKYLSMFADSINIMGKSFDSADCIGIDTYLNKVGNLYFKK